MNWKRIFSLLLMIVLVSILGLVSWQNQFTKDYSAWLKATPTINGQYKKQEYHVKKPVYDASFTPPTTLSEQVASVLKENLNGVRYFGTLRTMNKHLNVNIYDGISNQIFNTGNAGAYPGFDFEKNNSTIAAHTFASLGWHFYDGLTMIQHELNKGDKVYAYNGSDRYYQYQVMDKQVIPGKNGAYITKPDRWKDKKVNPSGHPMLTMYDCWENDNASIVTPANRNVVTLSLTNIYTKKDVPSKIKKLFTDVPYYKYDSKTKTIKVKDKSRKGNWQLQWWDFLFKTIKIQYLMKWIMKVF